MWLWSKWSLVPTPSKLPTLCRPCNDSTTISSTLDLFYRTERWLCAGVQPALRDHTYLDKDRFPFARLASAINSLSITEISFGDHCDRQEGRLMRLECYRRPTFRAHAASTPLAEHTVSALLQAWCMLAVLVAHGGYRPFLTVSSYPHLAH